MVAVGFIAILLADPHIPYSWWGIKPVLYIVSIPLVSAILALREPSRPMIKSALALNALLLLAWYLMERPIEEIVLGRKTPTFIGDAFKYPIHPDFPTISSRANYILGWVVSNGTMPDLLCLAAPLLALPLMLARPVPRRIRLLLAMILVLVATYGWATSRRWGGSASFAWRLRADTPSRLVGDWLRGEVPLSIVASEIGPVRALELLVLIVAFVCLASVAWRAPRWDNRMR
jgi:hypothetical protein